MIVTEARRVVFDHATVLVGRQEVVTIFADRTMNLLDIRRAAGDPAYLGYAASCGYEGGDLDYRRYARHHDLTHSWLAEQAGTASPVLWHDARGEVAPGWEREEHHVNCLQRLWTDQLRRIRWREKELTAAREALGEGWRTPFNELTDLLCRIQ